MFYIREREAKTVIKTSVDRVSNNKTISFGRALNQKEKLDYIQTLQEAKQKLGADGKSVLIVHDACLPQSELANTGVGNLSSKESLNYFDMMKNYLGINHVETLPPGEMFRTRNGFYCPYSGSSMSLGSHQINLELLTQPEFANILTAEEFKKVVNANDSPTRETLANFENTIGWQSNQEFALKSSFERLKKLENNEAKQLRQKFEQYKHNNAEILEPKSIFQALVDENKNYQWENWNELDKNLFNSQDSAKTAERISELTSKHSDLIEFYKFKQFLADEHLNIAKNKLNQMGIKIVGDCPIGFTADEVWANQSAFEKAAYVGNPDWKLPAINYDKLYKQDGSLGDAGKLLQKKFSFYNKRYDSVRYDVGWSFAKTKFFKNGKEHCVDLGDKIFRIAEQTAKSIKGQDYDLKNLMYECDGGPLIDWNNGQNPRMLKQMDNRVKIYATTYMHNEGAGWGSVDFFVNKTKIPAEDLLLGVGNHDPLPLRQLAEGLGYSGQKEQQIKHLSNVLKIPESDLSNPINFAKAKFAELFTGAKNHMYFYMDVLGRKERFDSQEHNSSINYRYKITKNFEQEYHTALQDGHGFNIMDSMEKAFKSRKLDEQYPELFSKIQHYSKLLMEKGAITEAEADEAIKAISKTTKKFPVAVAILVPSAIIAFASLYKLRQNLQELASSVGIKQPNKADNKIFDQHPTPTPTVFSNFIK